MLILSRKPEESIVIGDAVRITVLGMKGGEVRLGIDAPNSVKILRGELADRSERGNGAPAPDTAVASK